MKLNHSAASIIAKWLIDNSYATDSKKCADWPVFVSQMPNEPDEVVVVKDTAGKLGGKLQTSGSTIVYFGVAVRVRGVEYQGTWNKANDLFNRLSVVRQATVAMPKMVGVPATNYKIHCVGHASGIAHLGTDAKQRNDFIFDSRVTLTMET